MGSGDQTNPETRAIGGCSDRADWRVDFENNRFQMMWDDDILYFLTRLRIIGSGIRAAATASTSTLDNGNLYLDPNLDGEANTDNSVVIGQLPGTRTKAQIRLTTSTGFVLMFPIPGDPIPVG